MGSGWQEAMLYRLEQKISRATDTDTDKDTDSCEASVRSLLL